MKLTLLIGAALTALALGSSAHAASGAIEPAKKFHFGFYGYAYPVAPYVYAPYGYAPPVQGPTCYDERYYPYHGCY
jgi:hypothetical protein